jgi:arabinofuranan 3-O-arabinosyltransferase
VTARDAATRDRLWQWSVSVCLVVLAFIQSPGLVSADTKLDLVTNPVGFLSRATSLWDPLAAAGQLQNQAYGYLFPMGPFFAAGLGVGLPAWVVQRLWWALILLVAYHGARRLCVAWGVGTPGSRIAAALAFALAPRLLGTLGAVSSEVWPMALAPWVLLPLVRVRPGDERRAAARSGVAVLLLGGINAVASGAALVLPALWLASRRSTGSVRRLQLWWVACVTAACAWWAVPLLLLGRYSPPFLDWIESSEVTTAPGSLTEAVRGTTQWIAGLVTGQGPRWPAAHAVLVDPTTVALGVALALVGVAGLVHRRMPHRRYLVLSVLVGLVLVTAGHVATVASPWASGLRELLDGPLSPLRNVHKFEPVVRLPLVLGLAHALTVRRPFAAVSVPWARLVPGVVVGSALLALTAPAALVGVSQLGAYREVPGYWREAARWLGDVPDGARTLVLPGAPFASSTWGDPRDEPLQPFAQAPWLVRDGVPLGSGGLTRVLTAIEDRVATGYGGPELGRALSSLGVRRVLLRNDLDWRGGGAPSPLTVRQAVLSIPGAEPVARFGPVVGGSPRLDSVVDSGMDQPMPALEVVELPSSPPSLVHALPASGMTVVGGGPEAVLTAAGTTGSGFVLASDLASRRALDLLDVRPPEVLTDTLQRREATFSAVRNARGPVLTAHERFRASRAAHDWLPAAVNEDDVDRFTVAAEPDGRARASSSSDRPWAVAPRMLAGAPAAAFDGSAESAWHSSSPDVVGQWVRTDYPTEVTVPPVLDVLLDVVHGADVGEVTVTTDRGSTRSPVASPSLQPGVDESRYAVQVAAPAGATRLLKLTIDGTRSHRTQPVVVRDVGAGQLPPVATTLVVPGAVHLDRSGSTSEAVVLAATDDERPACVSGPDGITRCDPRSARPGEQDVALDRVVRTTGTADVTLSGTVLAAGSSAVDALLQVPGGLEAQASSRWVDDPRLRPAAAVDGDPATYWAPSPDDPEPTIRVTWGPEREVSRFTFRTADAVSGARPTKVRVRVGDRTVDADVDIDGTVQFPPSRARGMSVTVLASRPVPSVHAGGSSPMPVAVGEITIAGLEGLARALPPQQATGMPCGFGPRLVVDGHAVPTRVAGTVADLLAGRPLRWSTCQTVPIEAGTHRLRAESTVQFVVRSMRFGGGTSVPTAVTEAPEVQSWGRTSRTLRLATSGSGRVLTVAENANPGWTATLDGHELNAVTVDGWAQGWAVPAGQGGTVQLTFGPQRTFVAGLISGGILALVVVVLAAVRPQRTDELARVPSGWAVPVALAVLGGTALLVALCGPLGLVALPAAALAAGRRSRPVLVVMTGGAGLAWALSAAVAPWPAAGATNRQGAAEVLAAVVLASAVALTLVTARWSRGR